MAIKNKMVWLKELRGANLKPSEYMVLVTMSTYANADGTKIYPGVNRLVADTGMSKSTVKYALKQLQGNGFIRLVALGGNQVRDGQANEFELLPPPKLPVVDGYRLDDLEPTDEAIHKGPILIPPRGQISCKGSKSDPHQIIYTNNAI